MRVGALARHAQVERDARRPPAQPLIREALRQVAHPVVRNRGTTLGSIVHADPAAEMPAVLCLLEGEIEVASVRGRRVIAAADLYVGPLESHDPPGRAGDRGALPGRSRGGAGARSSSWPGATATTRSAASASLITTGADGSIETVRAAYVSVAGTPQCLDLTEHLRGQPVDTADWSAVDASVHEQVQPDGDIHASAEYRRHLAVVLTGQALATAAGRIGEQRAAA